MARNGGKSGVDAQRSPRFSPPVSTHAYLQNIPTTAHKPLPTSPRPQISPRAHLTPPPLNPAASLQRPAYEYWQQHPATASASPRMPQREGWTPPPRMPQREGWTPPPGARDGVSRYRGFADSHDAENERQERDGVAKNPAGDGGALAGIPLTGVGLPEPLSPRTGARIAGNDSR